MRLLHSGLKWGQQALQRAVSQHWGFILGVFFFNYMTIAWSLWQTREYLLMAGPGSNSIAARQTGNRLPR